MVKEYSIVQTSKDVRCNFTGNWIFKGEYCFYSWKTKQFLKMLEPYIPNTYDTMAVRGYGCE